MRQALAVGRKEFRQIMRDRRTLAILLLVPVIFLVLYGYALNFDIRDIRLAVQDRDHTTQSREIVSAFVNSGYFELVTDVRADEDIERLIDRNQVRAALVIPEGLGERVLNGESAAIQVVIDGDNSSTASTVLSYATLLARTVSARLQVQAAGPPGAALPVSMEPRVWFNPELKSSLFLVPGLVAFIGMITAAISTALSVVREKEHGTMEQVRMAPMSTVSYVLGKTIPYLGISFVSSMGIVLAGMALFGMPMRGSWIELMIAIAFFLLCALGTGLLISTVADSQLMAFQVVLLVAFLPTFLLSGFVFPISSMPVAVQVVTYIVPARYFLVALRGIVLKGAPLHVFWPEMAGMAIYATLLLGLASVRLAKERS